jgi:diacylglycerol kinase (ATP)
MTHAPGSQADADPGRVRIIVNPASGRGRGARRLGAIRAAFAVHGLTDVVTTRAAGDEARLVRTAVDDGIDTLVVAGGDGTWSKCATTLARAGSPARIAFLAAGTGNDFAKNLRAPARHASALARLVASGAWVERRADLGRVDDHWFLNVAGFGFDVAVLRAIAAGATPGLRGPALYVATALRQLAACEGVECRLSTAGADGTSGDWCRRLLLVFSNGAHFGGAFRIAPGARVDDGALDAIVVDDAVPSAWRRAGLLARALVGAHLRDPRVAHARAAGFRAEFREAPWLEVDGELVRAAGPRCEVASLPGVLRVLDAARRND